MLIGGAGGHALEILGVILQTEYSHPIAFFDDITQRKLYNIFGKYPVITTISEAEEWLKVNPLFCIGVGKPLVRKLINQKLESIGGKLSSVISGFAQIGKHEIILGEGLNIMTGAVITEKVVIGKGSLIHIYSSIHHEVSIGAFCEISPGSRILGNVVIGEEVSVGSNAVILPGLTIGDRAVIGAGSVVTKDVPASITVMGVPARNSAI